MTDKNTGTLRLKTGLAEMLKGGVIMDVTDDTQARIAQDAGAAAEWPLAVLDPRITAIDGAQHVAAASQHQNPRAAGKAAAQQQQKCRVHPQQRGC